jgi:ATP-dependent DNA helicase DinG
MPTDQLIVKHMQSKEPTVLISPSLGTGLDLKDDAARFAIIVKIPYPDLNDRWIHARLQRDQEWYD